MFKKIIIIVFFVLVLCMPVNAVNGLGLVSSDREGLVCGSSVIFMGSFFNPRTLTGGDILDNLVMQEYLSDTNVTRNILYLSRLGTPMVVYGNGSGPRVMVVAGVHGNELPPQIASMKLINYLEYKKINGTVIIVPFVSPSSTAKNQRFWNEQNLNRVVNEPGTPTYHILKLAKILKIDVLGDFHSTQPHADPGRNSIFCSKNPTYESYDLAVYISQQTQSDLIIFENSGTEYKGAVEDCANLAKITAVTCEVLSPHGTAQKETIEKSLIQMIALLKYKNIII